MTNEIYSEMILEHYKNPMNFGEMSNPDIESYEDNPICGDRIKMQFKLNGKKIEDVKFSGDGCAISIASASMLTSKIKGKNLSEVKKIAKEDVFKLLGIKLTAARVKCALLPLKVLKMSLVSYLKEKQNVDWNSL